MKELVDSKKLTGIMPFNEVFYRDCFYSSLFSVLKYFNCDILGFFLNDLIMYKASPGKWLRADIEYIPIQSVKELLEDLNVDCVDCMECKNIIDAIQESLNDSMPIIVKVDCFYEPIRKDLYWIEHLDHNLLVYGYNNSEETFNILEHNNRNSLRYKYETISYSSMQEASDGYRKHFGYLMEPMYMKFYKSSQITGKKIYRQEYYLSRYITRYLEKRVEIMESMDYLLNLKDRLVMTLQNQNLLEQYADELLDFVTVIITAKKIEQYRIANIFRDEKLQNIMKSIVNDWTFVRLSIFNYKYSGENIYEKLSSAVTILDRLYLQEKKFASMLFETGNRFHPSSSAGGSAAIF